MADGSSSQSLDRIPSLASVDRLLTRRLAIGTRKSIDPSDTTQKRSIDRSRLGIARVALIEEDGSTTTTSVDELGRGGKVYKVDERSVSVFG